MWTTNAISKKKRHDKMKNISGTWGKIRRWGNATIVFETALKVILSVLIFFNHGVCRCYRNLHYLCWTLKILKLRWITSVLFCWATLLWQGGWTRWPTEVPSNPYHSVILWFCELWYSANEIEYYFTRTIRNAFLLSKSLSITSFFSSSTVVIARDAYFFPLFKCKVKRKIFP